MLAMPANPVDIHHDGWGMKKLFSHALRRVGNDGRSDPDHTPTRKVAYPEPTIDKAFLCDRDYFKPRL